MVVARCPRRQPREPLRRKSVSRPQSNAIAAVRIRVPTGVLILIGQVVLETLDLIADCTNRTLTPRYPDYPLLKLK